MNDHFAFVMLAVSLVACGGQVTNPGTTDGDVEAGDDSGTADAAPPISAACMDDAGTCKDSCTTPLVFGDLSRNCWESAYTCLDEPFVSDGAGCGAAYCYVDQANSYMFTTTCVKLTAPRWRPCTQDEIDKASGIMDHCKPPYKVEGQFF